MIDGLYPTGEYVIIAGSSYPCYSTKRREENMSEGNKAIPGTPCYGKSVPGAYGSVVLGRIRDDVRDTVGKVIEGAIKESLIRHVGIDLTHQGDIVRGGDTVLLPGGVSEDAPEGCSSIDLDRLLEVLGVDLGDVDTNDTGALEKITESASAVRVRLGGICQTLLGDGCDDFEEGVQDLEEWLKKEGIKKLALSVLGLDTDAEYKSLNEMIELALLERPYQEILQGLLERDEQMSEIRDVLLKAWGLDATDLSTIELLRRTVVDREHECERRQAVQDRVQALLIRLVGECGEGMRAETMLDRIEAFLGPIPEF